MALEDIVKEKMAEVKWKIKTRQDEIENLREEEKRLQKICLHQWDGDVPNDRFNSCSICGKLELQSNQKKTR